MKIESGFDTVQAMDMMLPFLSELGIRGRQIDAAIGCTEIETAHWLYDLYYGPFLEVKRIHSRHPQSTWDYYRIQKVTQLVEVKLYRAAMRKLYEAWYKDRPEELTRKKAPSGKRQKSTQEPVPSNS